MGEVRQMTSQIGGVGDFVTVSDENRLRGQHTSVLDQALGVAVGRARGFERLAVHWNDENRDMLSTVKSLTPFADHIFISRSLTQLQEDYNRRKKANAL